MYIYTLRIYSLYGTKKPNDHGYILDNVVYFNIKPEYKDLFVFE